MTTQFYFAVRTCVCVIRVCVRIILGGVPAGVVIAALLAQRSFVLAANFLIVVDFLGCSLEKLVAYTRDDVIEGKRLSRIINFEDTRSNCRMRLVLKSQAYRRSRRR